MNRVKFGDIVKDVKVNVDRQNNPYEFYIAGDHMDSEDLTIHRKGRFATDDVGPAFVRIFKPGQVLYGSRRTYLKKIAVADFSGICANTTFVFESKDKTIFEQRLLPFIMLSDSFTSWSISKSKGSTNPYVLFSDLADYEFDLPSLEEQKVLADKLWAAYRLKEGYKRLLAATDEMVKSQFIEMFGTSCDSVKTILSDFVSLKAGKNKKSELIKDVFTDGLYPCYGGNGIRGYVEDYTHSGIYCIIGRQGAQCGNVQIAEGEFYATEHAVVVTPLTDVNSIWLFHALTQMNLNQYARGAAQPGLAVNQLEILPFSLPSIASQTQFALIAEQADKSKSHVLKALKETEILLQHSIRQVV